MAGSVDANLNDRIHLSCPVVAASPVSSGRAFTSPAWPGGRRGGVDDRAHDRAHDRAAMSRWGRPRLLDAVDPATRRAVALVCVADAVVGASFGAISVSGGLPFWVPVAMSVLVFAGGAQFAAVGAVLAGGSPWAGVLAGLVLNGRLLPFGIAVADVLGGRWPARLVGAHVLTDESVAFALRERDPARRHAAFWLCGLGLFVCWNLAVLVGAALGRVLGSTDAFGLDAAFPAVLLALVVPVLARRTRTAAIAGAVLAVACTPLLPAGLPVLVSLLGLLLVRLGPDAGPRGGAGPPGAPEGPGRPGTADLSGAGR